MSKPIWENPSFCKLMVDDDFNTRMEIPPAFKEHFGMMIRKKLVLRTHGGRQWKVKVRAVDDGLYIKIGWKRFISDNAITSGDVLVFFYDGDSGFDLKIYGKLGCEKDKSIPIPSEKARVEGKHPSEVASQKMSSPTVSKKRKAVGLEKTSVKKNKQCYKVLRAANDAENEKALKAACSIKYIHPHFVSTCRKLRTGYMTLPLGLVKKYKLDQKDFITLGDPHGTSWPVKLTRWRDGRLCLASGWALFYEKNDLKEGDVCVFEFVEEGTKINVHIFRAEEYNSKPAQKSGKRLVAKEDEGRVPRVKEDKSRVLRAVNSFESRHPRFVINWTPSRLYHVRIPQKVATKVGIEENRQTILSDPSGRRWGVQLVFRPEGQVELGRGFANFVKANDLAVGDSCLFEFVKGAEEIKVHIFRVGETSNPSNNIHSENP